MNYADYFFHLPKINQQIVGLWPLGNRHRNMFLRTICGLTIISMSIPQIRTFIHTIGVQNDEAFYSIAINLYLCLTFMKLFTSIVAQNKLRNLIKNVKTNWETTVGEQERKILISFSNDGKTVVLNYLYIFGSGIVLFLILPCLPIVLDKYFPIEQPRARIYLVGGDFGFNPEDYFIYVYIYDAINTIITCGVISAVDILYITCVYHCVGLFAITAQRLRHIPKVDDVVGNFESRDKTYEWLIETIKWHKLGLRFADILENTFSGSFLVLTGINLVYFSILSIVIVINLGTPINVIRYVIVATGCMGQLFFMSWPGQKLADTSSGLYEDAYHNEWYIYSGKSKVLIKIMFLRSSKASLLTAGRVYTMNLENFMTVMKTSISYITVFSSFL